LDVKNSLRKSLLEGAATGVSAWVLYGIVEFALAVTIPALQADDLVLLPWQWRLVGLLFAAYALTGVVLGSAGGAVMARKGRMPTPDDHKRWASLTLSLAFVTTLATGGTLLPAETIALWTAIALAVLFLGSWVSASLRRRTAFLASPAMVSLLLLIGPWVSRETLQTHSDRVKTAASVLAMVCLVAAAAILHLILRARQPNRSWRTAFGAAAFTALVVLAGVPDKTGEARPATSVGSAPGRPNILLITMDTVRRDHVSVFGYEKDTTPNLRQFAGGATRYDRAISSDGFTLPTHASMFTGLYPGWHGATRTPEHSSGAPLAPGTPVLASILAANGYWTAEEAANYGYLGKWTGLTRGFQFSEVKRAMRLIDADRPFYLREYARKVLRVAIRTDDFDQFCLRASDINRRAFALLQDARTGRRPFFLFLNYMDAHAPYLPRQPFRDRFASKDESRGAVSAQDFAALRDAVAAGRTLPGDLQKQYLISRYDAGIATIDFHVGELLARLRELGLYDNTLIFITADHGESFGEHNLMEHGFGSLYEDQIGVPLLVKYPGQRLASRSDAVVSQVDFLPTILEAAGIAIPPGLQGQSLRSPRDEQSGAVFAQTGPRRDERDNARLRGTRRAARSSQFKLILWSDGPPEFYDLASDPGERDNRYRPDNPQAALLMAQLKAWEATPRRKPLPSNKPADKTTLQKLKSLGYVQ